MGDFLLTSFLQQLSKTTGASMSKTSYIKTTDVFMEVNPLYTRGSVLPALTNTVQQVKQRHIKHVHSHTNQWVEAKKITHTGELSLLYISL